MNDRKKLVRRCFRAAALLFAVCLGTWAWTESVRFNPVPPELVQNRLGRFALKNQEREQALKQMFGEAGCDEQHVHEQPVKGSKAPNIACTLPGSSDRTIIVGAHFDHVSQGDGVVDNWSGASLLPSLYEAIKSEPRKHTYVFVGFTDEEVGEVGSHFYAGQMTKEQIAATDAMVNMDTLGLAPSEVWASHGDKGLVNRLFTMADTLGLPLSSVNVDQIGTSDSEQFAAKKIPSLTIHSLTQQTWNANILHTSKDKLSQIRMDDYYDTYKLVAAYLAFLDELPGEQK